MAPTPSEAFWAWADTLYGDRNNVLEFQDDPESRTFYCPDVDESPAKVAPRGLAQWICRVLPFKHKDAA